MAAIRAPRHRPTGRARPGLTQPLAGLLNRLPTTVTTGVFGGMLRGVDFVTSNVPGAPIPLFAAGAEIVQQFPFGPLSGAATNITLLSWLDQVCIGVNVDPAAVGDPELHRVPRRRLRRGHRRRLMDHTADVAVVGGGPAGAAAAIRLARQGRDVVLVDKATFPRDKICGDGLTAGALRLLEELGLDPAAVPSWQPVDDVVVRSPSGARGHLPAARAAGARTRRSPGGPSSTPRCSTWPASAGVKVHDGHACTGGRGARRPGGARRRGHRRRRRPLRHRRRRHVVAAAQAPRCVDARLPGRVARLPAVLHRRRTRAAPETCSCGSRPTSSRATPGRSRCPAAAPTSASASSATAARSPASRT